MSENTNEVQNPDPAEEKRTVVEGNGVDANADGAKDESASAPVQGTVTETETVRETTTEPAEPQGDQQ